MAHASPSRRPPDPDSATLPLASDRSVIDAAMDLLLSAVERHGYQETTRFALRLAVEEALANAFQHGHRGLPPTTEVTLAFTVDPKQVTVTIEDQGPGFDPGAVPDPTDESNLERPNGRGLLLMRAYMTSVEFQGRGNRVVMTLKRRG